MAFEFSDEHEELRRTVRQFFENESDETKVRELMASERGFEDATWKQMAEELGLAGLIVPEIHGGADFGAVELAALDDADLAEHLEALLNHIRWTFEEHFRLHGYDLGPIGQLLVAGNRWGIPGGDLLGALVGASPSTSAPSILSVGSAAASLMRG